MADRLDELPLRDDTQSTPQEMATLQRFFENYSPSKSSSSGKKGVNWKLVAIAAGLFALLANPWTDMAIAMLPKCDNAITSFGIRLGVFILGLIVAMKWFC